MSFSASDLSITATQGLVPRSDGPLCRDTRASYRLEGVGLAFDPLQGGWVPAACRDDLAPSESALTHGGYGFRDWRPEDAAGLARMLSEPDLWRYMPEGRSGPVDEASAAGLIDIANDDPDHWVQAVTLHGRVIGQVRVQHPRRARAEVSYWFDKPVWGKGHGRAVVARFTAKVLARFRAVEVLFARVHRENHASRRLVERIGYAQAPARQEGDWLVYERCRNDCEA